MWLVLIADSISDYQTKKIHKCYMMGYTIKKRKGKVFMLQELEDKIGYHFKDKKYLKTALTHFVLCK